MMLHKMLGFFTLLYMLFGFVTLSAEEVTVSPRLQMEIDRIQEWSKDSSLIKEIESQNKQDISKDEIQKRDREWIAESGTSDLMQQLLSNVCAQQLKTFAAKNPAYAEIFVMDNKGALVCMTQKTSDYWQGDEEKWSKAFLNGKGAIFLDKRQYDTSAKSTLQHISVPVFRDTTAIGVITVGVNLTKLVQE